MNLEEIELALELNLAGRRPAAPLSQLEAAEPLQRSAAVLEHIGRTDAATRAALAEALVVERDPVVRRALLAAARADPGFPVAARLLAAAQAKTPADPALEVFARDRRARTRPAVDGRLRASPDRSRSEADLWRGARGLEVQAAHLGKLAERQTADDFGGTRRVRVLGPAQERKAIGNAEVAVTEVRWEPAAAGLRDSTPDSKADPAGDGSQTSRLRGSLTCRHHAERFDGGHLLLFPLGTSEFTAVTLRLRAPASGQPQSKRAGESSGGVLEFEHPLDVPAYSSLDVLGLADLRMELALPGF